MNQHLYEYSLIFLVMKKAEGHLTVRFDIFLLTTYLPRRLRTVGQTATAPATM